MGYYDFNDHFWSPQEVCAQAPKPEIQEPSLTVVKLMQAVFRKIFCRGDRIEPS